MAQVTGVVDNVSTKYGKYSIQVGGNWYGTKEEWAKVKPQKGDNVSFDDGGGKYLKNVKILDGSPAPTVADTSNSVASGPRIAVNKEVAIIRQNSLSHAAAIMSAVVAQSDKAVVFQLSDLTEATIIMAKKFEAYSAGWADLAEAEAEAKELLKTVEE